MFVFVYPYLYGSATNKLASSVLQEPEYQAWFLVEIYQVGAGAAINETSRFANITMAESDDPQGIVFFTVGHRLPVAMQTASKLNLQVNRQASTASAISVQYRTLVRNKHLGM